MGTLANLTPGMRNKSKNRHPLDTGFANEKYKLD